MSSSSSTTTETITTQEEAAAAEAATIRELKKKRQKQLLKNAELDLILQELHKELQQLNVKKKECISHAADRMAASNQHRYGLWMSSKKKPIFIPDPPITTVSTMTNNNQPSAEEENNNGNTNNNNYNSNDGDMKPEPISAAFVSNQPSRLSQPQQQQKQEQQKEQQYQDTAAVYPYSVKIEQDTKGNAKISVHTYHTDINTVSDDAVKVFLDTRRKLQDANVKVLE